MSKTPDGRQIYVCPTCKGSGTQQQPRAGRKGKTEYETVDCRHCDGSGQIVGGPA